MQKRITSIAEAAHFFEATMKIHPERDMMAAQRAALAGERRKYPVLGLSHLGVPDDLDEPVDEFALPEVTTPDTPEGTLAREIIGLLEPLKMLNPVSASLGLGMGPGTMATCFGIPLNPRAVNRPSYTRSIDEVVAEPMPDPETAGLMPEMHERIQLIKDNVPASFKIGLPDMQGPFNVAHSIVGEEMLTAPYLEPEKLHKLMDRVTDFWIAARKTLIHWVGAERLHSWNRFPVITECSVNLVSPKVYKEFILPSDLRLVAVFGRVGIHPCSGPHVFHVTLDNVPEIVCTEAGHIENTCAGSISVDEALEAIGDRPIMLGIGQELPRGGEFEFMCLDLDRYEINPRLTFGYTGMHWRKKDRPMIREMHRRLDDYWAKKYSDCK